jgi:hypothetical protein
MRFKSFTELRDWFVGKGDDQDDAPADTAPSTGEADDDADEPVDECPQGGEHEWHDVMAATSRTPLHTYCTKCKQTP